MRTHKNNVHAHFVNCSANMLGNTYIMTKYKEKINVDYVIGGLKMIDITVNRSAK